MSVTKISNMRYGKAVFQSSIAWALCIALFESFQVATSASVRYIHPWDILVITAVLFLCYSILWLTAFMFLAVFLKPVLERKHVTEKSIALLYWSMGLFLYELFWILYRVESGKSYTSSWGIFASLAQTISAALLAYGVFRLSTSLKDKGGLNRLGLKWAAFSISLLCYMMLYVYLKSVNEGGISNPTFSVVLLVFFLIIFGLSVFLINKLPSPSTTNSGSSTTRGIMMSIVFVSSLSLFFSFPYYSSAMKKTVLSRPNILLISIDTLRADHLSCYQQRKKPTSPNIDKLAHRGFLFRKAYSPSSWTLPAHASMMTGLFPESHHADRSQKQTMSHPVDPLSPSMVTLAEIMRDHGYLTAGIISNPFLSSSFGMDQGFENYSDQVDLLENVRYLSLKDRSMLFKLSKAFHLIDKNDYDGERRAGEVNRKAYRWLGKNKGNPFFLFLHYNEPHFVYEPPAPYNKTDDGRTLDVFLDIERLVKGQYSLSTEGLNDLIALYDGEISYLDDQLGELFGKLAEWDLLDKTLVILTADHGESLNEHEIWQHGNSLYEEQIHIPLILRYPGIVPEGVVDNDHIVQHPDLMPTILDLLEIPIPQNVQGRNLMPILKGKATAKFYAAFASIRPDINWKPKNPRYGHGMQAVIHKAWKYILNDDGREELYRLDVDPEEQINLASKDPIKVDEMRKDLDTWKFATKSQKTNNSEAIKGGRLEQLRALGYLE